MDFLKQSKRSYKEQRRPAGGTTWAAALLAVVFSAVRFYLAENVCRPGAQNVVAYQWFRGYGCLNMYGETKLTAPLS